MSIEAPRTEDMASVLFGAGLGRDSAPIEVRHGRLIPGPGYSQQEFAMLRDIAADEDSLPLYPLPTLGQLARIHVEPSLGCWELPIYDDAKNRARYASLQVAGLIVNKTTLAHRTMYKVFYGADAIPEGRNHFLDHLCENKSCCYPRHLELTTPGINTMRGRAASVAGQLLFDFGFNK